MPEIDGEIAELAKWINVECGNDTEVSSMRLAEALIGLGYRRQSPESQRWNKPEYMDFLNILMEYKNNKFNGIDFYKRLCSLFNNPSINPNATDWNKGGQMAVDHLNKSQSGEKIWPEKKVPSPHENHTFDDNWCYDCNCIVEQEDMPNGANSWNACHEAFMKVIEGRQ